MFSKLMGKEKETVIPGLPKGYAAFIAKLHGTNGGDNDNKLRLAEGHDVASVLAVSTALAEKPPEPEKPVVDTSTLQIGDAVDFNNRKIENYTHAEHFNLCGGIYQGTQERVNKQGLTEIWDIFAAPEDLTDENDRKYVGTYNNSVAELNKKRGWHGFDGECFADEKTLNKAFLDGTYGGGWFTPTKEILHGKNTNGDTVQSNNLYGQKDRMPAGSEYVTVNNGSDDARWYWSCTERPDDSSDVYNVQFSVGELHWDFKDLFKVSVRPVRAELRL